jgi:uncharacterized membrane protein YqjE
MADSSTSVPLLESARRLGTTVIDVAVTRLTLFSTDLQEAANRYVWLVLCGVIGAFFFALGVLLLTLAVIALYWDTHRLAALTIGGGVFLGSSAMIAVYIFTNVRQHRSLFAVTVGELAKDREHLGATR